VTVAAADAEGAVLAVRLHRQTGRLPGDNK